MSIATEVSRLEMAKSDLATAIAAKGVTVPSTTTLDGYAALVDQIQTGGGGFWTGGVVTSGGDAFDSDSGIIFLYDDMTAYYAGGKDGYERFGTYSNKNVLIVFCFYPYTPSVPGLTVPHFDVTGEYEVLTTGMSGKAYKILGDCTFTYVS